MTPAPAPPKAFAASVMEANKTLPVGGARTEGGTLQGREEGGGTMEVRVGESNRRHLETGPTSRSR